MENKKRLIDANALMKRFYNYYDCVNEFTSKNGYRGETLMNYEVADMIYDCIDNAPTVDAVEVVHGRWEDMWGGKYANPRYRCSVCKEKALYKSERDLLGNWKDVQALTPNCPYCMAKLDGGTENDI